MEGWSCGGQDFYSRAAPAHGGIRFSQGTGGEGTEQDLFAKAIAIEDVGGNRVVFVTLDLIGVREELRTKVAAQVTEKHQLPPQALLMNASHTHCGPAYGRDDAKDYFVSLEAALIELVGQAIERLRPATLSYSHARCSVATNRRTPTADDGRHRFGPVLDANKFARFPRLTAPACTVLRYGAR